MAYGTEMADKPAMSSKKKSDESDESDGKKKSFFGSYGKKN